MNSHPSRANDPLDGQPAVAGSGSEQPKAARQFFNGALEFFSVPEALQMIAGASKTGVLTYSFPDSSLNVRLALRNARIVGASGQGVPRLSETLLQLGVLPATVGALGLEISRAAGSAAQVALTRAAVGQAMLERALETRVIAALLLIWQRGDGAFEFVSSDDSALGIDTGLAVEALMLEVARRIDHLELDLATTGIKASSVYAIAERIGDFSSRIHALSAGDWVLLNELSSERTLAEVSRATMRPWDELILSIVALERAGLIEPRAAQRGIRRSYKALEIGQLAPAFSLPSLDGSSFSIGAQRGRHTLLAFHRHAGCPFCNLRIRELITAHPRLKRAGVDVIAVFSSNLEGLRERVGTQQPPFTLLADADDAVHTLYGTGVRLLGMLQPQLLALWLEGKRLGVKHGSIDGAFARMPADLLIGPDLLIEAVLYGSNAAQHIPIAALERWGESGIYEQ